MYSVMMCCALAYFNSRCCCNETPPTSEQNCDFFFFSFLFFLFLPALHVHRENQQSCLQENSGCNTPVKFDAILWDQYILAINEHVGLYSIHVCLIESLCKQIC